MFLSLHANSRERYPSPVLLQEPRGRKTTSSTMDSIKITELLDQLDDEIDDLEESLTSVLKTRLSDNASKLPLLDKAKLYVLTTYAIESILFCG